MSDRRPPPPVDRETDLPLPPIAENRRPPPPPEAHVPVPLPPIGLPAENRRALFPVRRRGEPSPELVAARAAREETRLAAEAARARVREARAAREPAAAQQGVAYEIHNAFDNFKLNKFMQIIRREITANPPSAGILPLFENPDHPLYSIIAYTFKQTGLTEEAKEEKISKLNLIQRTIQNYERFTENKENIKDVLKFVMTQNREVIDTYITTLITDCMKAYSTGRTASCVKGMFERIFYSVRDTLFTMCLDEIQGTGTSPLCKPVYHELLKLFYTMDKEGPGGLNELFREWYGNDIRDERAREERIEALSALSLEERRNSFIQFVREKLNNEVYFKLVEKSIIDYANNDLNAMFGGKRRRNKRSVKKRSYKMCKGVKRGNTKRKK